jgi:hypothetical protein
MSTSPVTTTLQVNGDRIASAEFSYFAARNRRKIYSVIIKEFKKSKLSQAQLARRMGQRTDTVCRWLSGPGNYTLDSVSSLLLGISGGELSYSVVHPFSAGPKKPSLPDWVSKRNEEIEGNNSPPPPKLGEERRTEKTGIMALDGAR